MLKRKSVLLSLMLLLLAFLAACGGGDVVEDVQEAVEQVEETVEEVVEIVENLECSDALGCVEVDAGDPIIIAYMLPTSGPVAFLGEDQKGGVEIAIDDRGGELLGHEIELTGEDSLCSAEGGQSAAQKIAADDSIAGIIGTACSSAATAALPIISESGLSMISSSNTAPTLTDADQAAGGVWQPGYYRTAHNDLFQGRVAAEFAFNELGARTLATVHDGSPYADGLQAVMADVFVELGGEVTFQGAVNVGDTDMRPILTEIASNAPDLLYFPIFEPEAPLMVAQSTEVSGLENTILFGADAALVDSFPENAGAPAAGMYLSGPYVVPEGAYGDLLAKWDAKFGGAPPSGFHGHAYDGANMLMDAIEAVAQSDADGNLLIGRQAIRDYISGISGYTGTIGQLSCNATGDCATGEALGVYQITEAEIGGAWPPAVIYTPGAGVIEAAAAAMDDGEMAMGEVTGAYAGETLEITVPYGEGGGSDTWTRALAPFLQKYLGDDVTVQVINMPGASGTLGANDYASREADGLTLLNSSGSNALPYILGQEAVQYDFADFTGIIGSPVGGVVYVSADTGITSVEDLCAAEGLIYGGLVATGLDMVPLRAFDLMDLDFLPILGYDGRGAARVAFEQGEITLDYQTSPAFIKNVMPLVEEGSAVPLFAFGILDDAGNIATDPVFGDLPNVEEAIATCGGPTSGADFEGFKAAFTAGFAAQKNLWIHGDAPADKIADLTAAAQMAIKDPEFQAIAADLLGGYEFYAGADAVSTAFGAASAMSDDAFNSLKNFLNDNYDAGIGGDSATTAAAAPEVAGAYAGETLEITVPYGEGGGSDTWTRALAPFLQKYLGDDVTVQVINMPGASGTLGANDYATRDADGLTLLNSSGSNSLPYILGQEAVQYDFADFAGVLGSPVGGVVYISADTGITSVEELCAADGLIYGGLTATGLDLVPLRAFDLMGLDFLPILGYDGRGAARVAFEQGEITLDYQTSPAFLKNVQPLVEEGSAVPLFAFGILDSAGNIATDPVFSDLPNVEEAIATCGGPTSGADFEGFKAAFTAGFAAQKNLWIHGDAPADKIADLTAAAQLALADEEFQAIAAELLGGYEFYAGADAVSTAFGAASSMSPEALESLKSWLNESYDAGLE